MLKTQLIDIPLSGGMDTKTDPKQVQVGKNLKLENMVMQKTGSVSKRNGYSEKGTGTTLSGESISAGYALYDYNDSLVLWGKDTGATTGVPNEPGFFTYAPKLNQWKSGGFITPVEFDVDRISKSTSDLVHSDMAVGAGYTLFWYKNLAVATVEIFETGSETPILFFNTPVSPGNRPRMLFVSDLNNVNESFVGIAADGPNGRLEKWTWDPDTPTDTTGTTGTITTNLHADGYFDAAVIEYGAGTADAYEDYVVAWKNSNNPVPGDITVALYDVDGVEKTSVVLPTFPIGAFTVAHAIDSSGVNHRILVIAQAADETIVGYSLNPNSLVTMHGPIELTNDAVGELSSNMTVAADFKENARTGEDSFRYWVETREDDGYNNSVFSGLMSFDAQNLSGLSVSRRQHTGLVGKAFSFENTAYVLEVYDSDTQPTYFLTSISNQTTASSLPRVHAKILRNRAGNVQKGLSSAVKTATGRYSYSMMRRDVLLSDGVITKSVAAVNLNMQPEALPAVSVNRNLYVGGGIITSFDNRANELGHNLFPATLVMDSITTTGGEVSGGGTYSYKLVWEWRDNQGNLHRSAPSAAFAVNVTSATETNIINLFAHAQSFFYGTTFKTPTTELYRTEKDGTVYYKTTIAATASGGGGGIGVEAFADATSDANLIDNELLYTTGGVLETSSAPATKIMASRKDRVFIVPMDDPFTVMFSKPVVEGVAVEFNDVLVTRIDVDGPNTALATLDDRVVVFKERSIYFFAGEGPNALGQGGFTPVRPIQTDVGCVNQQSVVNFGQGVMFKSHKGIYMLDRSLQVRYIGAPVEEFNDFAVKAATLVRDKNQVRFVLGSGQGVLVYDYFHQQWSRFTNHPAEDAMINDGKYTWVKSDGKVKQQSTNYRDVNHVVNFKVRTPWIKLQSLQGFQRVRRASIIGDFRSHHTLNVKIYQDYDDITIQQEVNYVTTANQQGDEPLQVEIHMKKQKCQSIMFEITDASLKGSLESTRLSRLTLDVGVKEGLNQKLPNRKTK